jgi:23S rRNA (adenine2503-C2)-methyltransferase
VRSLLALDLGELRRAFAAEGIEPWRASQVFDWIYRRRQRDFAGMRDLPRALRERLASEWSATALECERIERSRDGSQKHVLVTADGARIESVWMPEAARTTVCVSSQVGCSLDCTFCATGAMGLGRNLRAEEIVDQVLLGAERSGLVATHVVFMGMGEPLANLAAVLQAIRVLVEPRAFALSPRRITVSTAGMVPRMAELGRTAQVRLAVSLHATTDAVRDRLVPLNRRFPLERLLAACREYPLAAGERISFEYALIRDENDSPADARRLVSLLHGLRAHVNLIPLNEHPASAFRRSSEAAIDRFAAELARARLPVTVRRSRGEDVLAACGQLGALAPAPAQSSAPRRPIGVEASEGSRE